MDASKSCKKIEIMLNKEIRIYNLLDQYLHEFDQPLEKIIALSPECPVEQATYRMPIHICSCSLANNCLTGDTRLVVTISKIKIN